MADKQRSRRQTSDSSDGDSGGVPRRSYLRVLGALGGAGLVSAYATGDRSGVVAAQQDERADPRRLTVADSGTTVADGASHLDFADGLSAVESDAGVRIDADGDSATNPHVVDVRADLGVEPERDDVWGAIYDHYSSFDDPTDRCHEYVIPSGTWYVETDDIELFAHEYFGVVGEPFAVLEVTDQDVDRMMTVGTIDESLPHAQRTVMKNLRVDIRGEYDTGIGRWHTYGYGHVENVELRGRRDRLNPEYGGDRHTLKVDGIRPEATNAIRNVRFTHGDTNYESRDTGVGHAIPFAAEIYHTGTNIWEQCQVSGFLDNGIYVSNNSGRNLVVGCRAHNNAGANVRIGPNDAVLNTKIVMDEHPGQPWAGLWLDGEISGAGQVVDGLYCINHVRKNTEIVRCTQAGPAHLSNVHVTDDGGDGRAIRVSDDAATRTTFENCTITDRSSPTVSDYAVYVRSSNVVFRDCSFDHASQSEASRNGIFVDARGDAVDRLVLDNCEVDADVASLRFSDDGADHTVDRSIFRALVTSDDDTTLSNVLWTGNRHYGETNFAGARSDWKGDFNWGFEV